MDNGTCNIIYLDRRAVEEHALRNNLSESRDVKSISGVDPPGYFGLGKPRNPTQVLANVEALLTIFGEIHVCNSGSSCLTKLTELHSSALEPVPIILLIDIPYDEEQRLRRLSREPRTPSPSSFRRPGLDQSEPEDLYGMHLLQHLSSEIQQKILSKLIIPIALLSGLDKENGQPGTPARSPSRTHMLLDGIRVSRYIDAGAVDVYLSPLNKDHVAHIANHAYRIRREVSREDSSFLGARRNRKVSWVGVNEAKPYGYLREAMVSGLMNGICNPETIGDSLDPRDVEVDPIRQRIVASAIGTWEFSAHEFTDDELLHGALLMLQHALDMPELAQWRMDSDELTILLLASRTAYNDFVLYHNFRHVVDVLQALFYFLVQIGTLPPYPRTAPPRRTTSLPSIATLLKPFDALTLLVSAIGHDVGHPGVNNAFLVALNSPLAQLYNDKSVLESFHCAAYSQILRRYWPGAFSDMPMRKLMINNILATDMGVHFKYMADLGNLQEKLAHNKNTLDGWNPKTCEDYRDLVCGLLIKCADISNVARKFDTAANWADILTREFSNQGVMEQELQMPTCLFGGPPVNDCMIKMGESQIGFMNIFARPLFEAVSDILPAMRFGLEEILKNQKVWEGKIEVERERRRHHISGAMLTPGLAHDNIPSPFSEIPASRGAKQPQTPESFVPHPTNRPSSGSFPFQLSAAATSSRRSSLGIVSLSEKGSRRNSRQLQASDNVSTSRRGSADASITAIFVTQKQQSTPEKARDGTNAHSMTPGNKPGTAKPGSRMHKAGGEERQPHQPQRQQFRPFSAPSSSKLDPHSHTLEIPSVPVIQRHDATGPLQSQSVSETDLSQSANGEIINPKFTEHNIESNDGFLNVDSQSHKTRKSSPGRWPKRKGSGKHRNPIRDEHDVGEPRKKFDLGKIWRKITSNGDREEGTSKPKDEITPVVSRDAV